MNTANVPEKPRTQATRSTHTRFLVCEAAIKVLCGVGYDRLSIAMIAKEAQVSRGALTHHFPTKNEILVAAFEYLLKEWEDHRLLFVENLTDGYLAFDEYLDYLWIHIFSSPRYIAALELMLAARLDAQLREQLRVVLERWVKIRDALWGQVTDVPYQGEEDEVFLNLNLCVLRGMAIHSSFNKNDSFNRAILERWKGIVKHELAMRFDNQ